MHTLRRICGFELPILNIDGDANIGGVTFPTTGQRSGEYYCRIVNDGIAAGRVAIAGSFDANGTASTTQTFVAAGIRIWLNVEAYPDASRIIFQLEGAGGAQRSVFSMDTTGILTLDATVGTTVIPLNTWTEVTLVFDSTGTGLVNVKINRVPEFTNIVPAAPSTNGTFLRLSLGKTAVPGTYIIGFDDVAIEAGATGTVDHPAPGNVIAMDLDADGAVTSVWGLTGAATKWQACLRPHDGDTSFMAISGAGGRRQTFTLEAPAGVSDIINAVQWEHIQRRLNANNVTIKILAANSNYAALGPSFVTSITTAKIANTGYNLQGSLHQTSPYTSAAWAASELAGLVIGVFATATAGSTFRETTFAVMVDSQAAPGGVVNQTFIQEAQYPLGLLRSVTNYSPEIRSVKITSEAYGKPNEAFNIIACSIRHVPSGVGYIQGSWYFDNLAPTTFHLQNNPRRDAVMDSEETPFLLDESNMVDGQQVYTEYVRIEGSGKFFELSLSQEGSRGMEILAIDFELRPEGKKETYLGGVA